MRYPRAKGFTLIEIIVSVGLFAVVMLLVSGAYIQMIAINRQAQAVATASDNLGYALESIMRSIRTGYSYTCTPTINTTDCSAGTNFRFTDVNGCTIIYRALNSQVVMDESGGAGCLNSGLNPFPLTDPSITITSLKFYAQGTQTTAQGDYNQPQITVSLTGSVPAGPGKPPVIFTLESGATLRGIDL